MFSDYITSALILVYNTSLQLTSTRGRSSPSAMTECIHIRMSEQRAPQERIHFRNSETCFSYMPTSNGGRGGGVADSRSTNN